MRLIALSLLCILAACAPASDPALSGQTDLPIVAIDIGGSARSLRVEVAVSEAAQERGLMGRRSLPNGSGMLFPFVTPKVASFWMKGTDMPLDLAFIRPDGTVAAVLPGRPRDLTPISAGEAVSAVVEVARGQADLHGLIPGAHVRWGDCRGRRDIPGRMIDPLAFCPARPSSIAPGPIDLAKPAGQL